MCLQNPITDQQMRLYMTDFKQVSAQRAARAGFSERNRPDASIADPTRPSKRKIAHGRTVAIPLNVLVRPTCFFPSFWRYMADSGARTVAGSVHPVRHLQAHIHWRICSPARIRRTLGGGCAVAGSETVSSATSFFPPDAGAGIHGPVDFTHADEAGVDVAGQPFPPPCFITSSWATGRWEHGVASFFGGKASRRWPRTCKQSPYGRLVAWPQKTTGPDSLSAAFRNLTTISARTSPSAMMPSSAITGMDAQPQQPWLRPTRERRRWKSRTGISRKPLIRATDPAAAAADFATI